MPIDAHRKNGFDRRICWFIESSQLLVLHMWAALQLRLDGG